MTGVNILLSQPFWWIQFAMTVLILVVGIYQFVKLYVLKSTQVKKANIQLILVTGASTAVLGILLQVIGLVLALEAIIQASDVSPQIVLGGLKVSFYTTIYGFIVFILSAIIWYVNKIKWETNRE